MELRLRRALRSSPNRPSYARFPPNCDVRGRDLLCPLHVDSRRRPMSQMRKYRPFVENLPNRSIRPKGDLQVRVDERLENAPKRPMRSAEVPSGIAATSPS